VLSDSGSTSSTTYEPDPGSPATVQRIDPETNSLVGEPTPVGMTPGFLAVGLGSVWFGDFTDSTLTRLEIAAT
jgi:streptogramin lyase